MMYWPNIHQLFINVTIQVLFERMNSFYFLSYCFDPFDILFVSVRSVVIYYLRKYEINAFHSKYIVRFQVTVRRLILTLCVIPQRFSIWNSKKNNSPLEYRTRKRRRKFTVLLKTLLGIK